MNIKDILRVLKKNWLLLLLFPSLVSFTIYYLTKDDPKEYSSSVLIYTGIASGFKITSEEHPRLDHNAVNNAFDNLLNTLKARETMEEVSMRLLARHLVLDNVDSKILSNETFISLKNIFPDNLRKDIVVSGSVEETYQNLLKYQNGDGASHIYMILSSPTIYGINQIRDNIKAFRRENSDMLEVSYSCTDPGVCQNTLELLSEVFINKYRRIKEGEIIGVVNYFTRQAEESYKKLKEAENKLRDFGVKNKILNYDEEAKSIALSKQEILEEIRKEDLLYTASEATIKNLESKIDGNKSLIESNEKILLKRKQLADLNYKIANAKIYKIQGEEIRKLKEEADLIKEEIEEIVNDLYRLNNSQEGLPRDGLLNQWLSNKLVMDESEARLRLLNEKLKEFDKMYEKMAPLRPVLSSLEREVRVAEKEYMTALNALNINKQRQQNIELTSSLKVVDRPYYPSKPNASKGMMLVMIGFFVGVVLMTGGIVAREFFDASIKTPSRAERITGLHLAGVLPFRDATPSIDELESALLDQTISSIMIELNNRGKLDFPKKIVLTSAKPGEGKSWVSQKLAEKLSDIYGNTLFVSYKIDKNETKVKDHPCLKPFYYNPDKNFVNQSRVDDLLPQKEQVKDFKFVVLEIPSLAEHQLPVELISNMDLALIVIAADRSWTESDIYISRLYSKATNYQPLIVLNKVKTDRLEGLDGIKRKKSTGLKFFKRSVISKKGSEV
ncbi:MAG TPA: hypothetical protein VIK89_07480 [Cytophagaceae bacterium]